MTFRTMTTTSLSETATWTEAAATDAVAVNDISQWRLAKRIAFRFTLAYLAVYQLPLPLGALPWTEGLATKYQQLWHPVVAWVGSHLLHVSSPISPAMTGSGDKLYNWILALCHLAIAVIATFVWSMFDRRRFDYEKLDQWFRLYVRMSLAFWMMVYGGAKVFPVQFPEPLLALIQPYGESSPMRLLWTFMGRIENRKFKRLF